MDRAKINKMSRMQKKIMVEFMLQHRDLARNTNTKLIANRLWALLRDKLNKEGPPFKNEKTWRKAFADVKHSIKKKMTLGADANLSQEDLQVIEAAGLDEPVQESLPESPIENMYTITEIRTDINDATERNDGPENLRGEGSGLFNHDDTLISNEVTNTTSFKKDSIVSSLKDHMNSFLQNQKDLNGKIDKLIKINERSMLMKQEEHDANMALKRVQLEIKTMELEILRANSVVHS